MYRQSEKKLVKQQYLHKFSLYGERRFTNGWDRLASLGHPQKFQRVSRLGFVTAPTSLKGDQPNFTRCLAVSWTGALYIHFRGLLPSNGILQGAYICSVTARHSSSTVSQALRRSAESATYIRQGGHHVGIGPHSSFFNCNWLTVYCTAPLNPCKRRSSHFVV